MSCCGVMDFGHGDVHSPMCYMIWILRNILAKNVDFAQFVRYCKDKEEKTGPEKGTDDVEKTQAPVPVSCGGAGHTCCVLDIRTGERV